MTPSADLPEALENEVYDCWLSAPADDRTAASARLLADHPEHAAAIREVLRELTEGDALLRPVSDAVGPAPTRVGPFSLLERLGSGGFATVHRAIQTAPVRREVALKLLHTTHASGRGAQRFELERDALASLQHPGIARMFEAGALPDGRPYFAMELIDGPPLATFAEQHDLGVAQRLRLLQMVCDAVQHAHQRGVLHRDLKSNNVLVAGTAAAPAPKVIDFGLARFVDDLRATDLTLEGSMLGTPETMSPEQLAGRDVDTRTDVWSLGALLFELLTGDLPIPRAACRKLPLAELHHRRMQLPAPLASSVAPDHRARRLRGEIDWIVQRALEADPARRYQSVGDLARDLERHLEGAPVEARPPSKRYLLRKFLARHRAVVISAAALFTTIAVALVAVGIALVDARDARDEARRALREAEATSLAANLSAAFAAFDLHHPAEVRQRLAEVPIEARNWEWHHLQARTDTALRAWPAVPEARWHGAALCADHLVAGGAGTLRCYDVTSASVEPVTVIEDAGEYPRFVAAPAGDEVLESTADGRARLLHVPDLEVVRTLREPGPHGGTSVDWSADGRWIALGDDTGGCDLLPREPGPEPWSIAGLGKGVRPCFDPDSAQVACIGEQGVLAIHELEDRRELLRRSIHDGAAHIHARALSFTRDGSAVVCAFTDSTVTCVETIDGDIRWSVDLAGGRLSDLVMAPDGRSVIVAGGFAVAVLVRLDLRDGRLLHRYEGHTKGVEALAPTADGARFFSVSRDDSIRSWDSLAQASPLHLPVGRGIGDVAFTSDRRLITASQYGTLRSWSVPAGELLGSIDTDHLGARLCWDTPGQRLLLASNGRLAHLDVGTLTTTFEAPSPIRQPYSLVALPGDRFVLGGFGHLLCFRGTDLRVLWEQEFPEEFVAVARIPDSERLLAASLAEDFSRVLDSDGTELERLHTGPVTALQIDPGGQQVATTHRDGRVRLWQLTSGGLLADLPCPGALGLGWSPDGSRLAIGCGDSAMRLCDPVQGKLLVQLASAPECMGAWFSTDGRHLAALAGPLHGPATVLLWTTP